MKILITNHDLGKMQGSQTATLTMACALRRARHDVVLFANEREGPMVGVLAAKGFRILGDLVRDWEGSPPDVCHVHHNTCVVAVAKAFPDVPRLFLSHGPKHELERPPIDIGFDVYAGVSEEVVDSMQVMGEKWVVPNCVDDDEYIQTAAIRPRLERILVLSNHCKKTLPLVLGAVSRMDGPLVEVRVIGEEVLVSNKVCDEINRSDLVVTVGRGVLEAMACSRAVVVYDHNGGDGIMTPDLYRKSAICNFSGRAKGVPFTAEELETEFLRYDQAMGCVNRAIVCAMNSSRSQAIRLEGLYRLAIAKKARG